MSTALPSLSVLTVARWKSQLIDEAFSLNAYGILKGTESAPASSADARTKSDYNARKSAIIGLMRKSLDMAQKQTILDDIADDDAKAIYDALLATYEPKNSATRMTVMQELVALRKKEDEVYAAYGARAFEIADRLLASLPSDAPTLVPARTRTISYTTGTGATAQTHSGELIIEPASLTPGTYTVKDLCQQFALCMIPLGLVNKGDEMLQHTLTHLSDDDSDATTVLEHLQRSDAMIRNLAMAEQATASALAAKAGKSKFTCAYHKVNATHNSKDCYVLNKRKDKDDTAKAAAASSPSTSADLTTSEKAMMASVGHIRTDPTQGLPRT